MPTKRMRKPRSIKESVPEGVIGLLETGELKQPGANPLTMWLLYLSSKRPGKEDKLRLYWEELKGDILQSWRRQFPGTRPYAWWKYDAPPPEELADGDDPDREPILIHRRLRRIQNTASGLLAIINLIRRKQMNVTQVLERLSRSPMMRKIEQEDPG